MNIKTINTEFMAEVRRKTCINDYEEEVIKDALNKYYDALNEFFEEEYYNALNSARNKAYDDGYDAGQAALILRYKSDTPENKSDTDAAYA